MANEDLNDLLSLAGDEKPTEAADLEDLMSTPEDDAPAPDMSSVEEDDMDAEIAALKAALAEPIRHPDAEVSRPKPEYELTPKERELRVLKDQMAQRKALEAERATQEYDNATGDTILIHVMEDGFTVNGEVQYRGREIEFVKNGQAYEQTKNRHGKSWLDLTVEEQYSRWGVQKFGNGPWPFKRLDQLTLADLPDGSTQEDLARVKAAAARNDRRAPVARA